MRAQGCAILIVTGRQDRWSFLTSLWMHEQGIEFDELYLRPALDNRTDAEVKESILRHITRRYEPILAIDDKPETLLVWQRAGIPTIRVLAEGALEEIKRPAGMQTDRFFDFAFEIGT